MAGITEYLVKLQELTQTNLDILKTINDSFFTKQNHLSAKIQGNTYIFPSFLSLENKINSLAANFDNLVHAPESGEAYFNFDGNSRSIEVRPYTNTPNPLVLDIINSFDVENNDILKDFVTPKPYINIPLKTLPDDIVSVNVKKIIPIHQTLVDLFKSNTLEQPSSQYNYKDLYKILSVYKEDADYVEYDTKYELPIRKNIGHGIYVIEKIVEDTIDEHLDNYITLKLRDDMKESIYMNTLRYKLFDETIERVLKPGDHMTTYDGTAKMEVVEVRHNTNTIVIKVLHGEYLNLVPTDSNDTNIMADLSKIRFYSPIDFDEDKYIKVPLEEDQYVFVSIAAVNDRMNIQSSWGTGLMIDAYQLSHNDMRFDKYYKDNVKNIGDSVKELSHMYTNTISQLTHNRYNEITKLSPTIPDESLHVVRINDHLNNSETIKKIRNLYSQKKQLQLDLDETQKDIDSATDKLAKISFDDMNGSRNPLSNKLSSLYARKKEIMAQITSIMNDIAMSANNSEAPIENAKYRIRGFFDYSKFLTTVGLSDLKDHVKGIRVQYRYKNKEKLMGSSISLIESNFIYSDWNIMRYNDRDMISKQAGDDHSYIYELEPANESVNEPSFNQIDIPITQGEVVDVRLRLIYDYGYPFIQTGSSWGPIMTIEFPDEFLKDVHVLDIIKENNNDIESRKFANFIDEQGITEHIDDKIVDQNIVYYHKTDNIASGFYTEERRVIPLADKLKSMNDDLVALQDEIKGSTAESLRVSIRHDNSENILWPYQTTNVAISAAYDSFEIVGEVIPETKSADSDVKPTVITQGNYILNSNGVATTVLNIVIKNNTRHSVKLFSLFPGDRDTLIQHLKHYKFNKEDYALDNSIESTEQTPGQGPQTKGAPNTTVTLGNKGVWFEHPEVIYNNHYDDYICTYQNAIEVGHVPVAENEIINRRYSLQTGNQFITFRLNNVNNGEEYYSDEIDTNDSGISGLKLIASDKLSSVRNFINVENFKKFNNIDDNSIPDRLAFMYPKVTDKYSLHIKHDSLGGYMPLASGEEIIIPIVFEYRLPEPEDNANPSSNPTISKTMSFDLRPSLYSDPISYTFKVTAKYKQTTQDKVIINNNMMTPKIASINQYNTIVS